jgi:hypothetical protein
LVWKATGLGISQLKHWENYMGVCVEKTSSVQLAQKLKNLYHVKINCQETTSEGWEGFMCAAVTVVFGVRNSMRLP